MANKKKKKKKKAGLFTKHSSFLTLSFHYGGRQTMETSEKGR